MKQPHICLDETLGVRYAILPGDPARLDRKIGRASCRERG